MPRAGLTRDVVVAAAADLADDRGLDAVTPSEVARTLGVRTPSLYAHVAGARALLDGVTALALAELADAVGTAVAGRSGRDALGALADVYRDHAAAHPGRHAATRRRTEPTSAALEAGRRHTALLTAVLRGYDLPDDELAHAVRFVGGAVQGFVDLQRAGSFDHSAPSTDLSWHRTVDAVDAALRAWPGVGGAAGQ